MSIIFFINKNLGLIEIVSKKDLTFCLKNIPNDFFTAFGEEMLIRVLVFIGILYTTNSKFVALIGSSMIFCFLHNPESWISVFSYFLAGLMYGLAFLWLKTIWAPIGLHFAWNYFQGTMFGFPVSNQLSDGCFSIKIVNNTIWNGYELGSEGCILALIFRILIIVSTFLISLNGNEVFEWKIPSSRLVKY